MTSYAAVVRPCFSLFFFVKNKRVTGESMCVTFSSYNANSFSSCAITPSMYRTFPELVDDLQQFTKICNILVTRAVLCVSAVIAVVNTF